MSGDQGIAVALLVLFIFGTLAIFITMGKHYGLFREEEHP